MREAKLMVRLSGDEKGLLDEAAAERGSATATWARTALLKAARDDQQHSFSLSESGQEMGLLSLFCGAGGLDQGFKGAGFHTILALDNNQQCVNTFSFNHREARTVCCDVGSLTVKRLDDLASRTVQPIGVLGGPPCQSFSVSNVHQRDDDPRHRLPEAYASLLAKLNKRRPISFFVFENVPGLLGKKHIHRYEHFKRLFAKAGFTVHEKLLDAKDFGVPQERPRIIVVGINHKKHPGKVWTPPEAEDTIVSVAETIRGLPEPIHNASGLDPETFSVHPNHWCLVPRSKKFANGSLKQGEMWGRSFRSLSWDKPSWTVAYGHREVHVHPNGKRRLSIYEAMLLQSFPPQYRLLGNMTAQIKLVSDAVPPRMAHKVAQSIRKSLGL